MKTLVTGSSGFLGGIIKEALVEHQVVGLARSGADVACDLASEVPKFAEAFDCVVHAAGKAHVVPQTEAEKEAFYAVNYQGTVHLTEALSDNPPQGLVFISTVAVYGENPAPYADETSPLKGDTSYAESKIMAESFLQTWAQEHGVALLILRLPLISGANPPGNLGKMIKGLSNGKYLRIAQGTAKRSLVSAYDVANFIKINFGAKGVYNLTDQVHPTFKEIEQCICQRLRKKEPLNINYKLAKVLGIIGDILKFAPVNSLVVTKMTSDVTFSSQKASKELNWVPSKGIEAIQIK